VLIYERRLYSLSVSISAHHGVSVEKVERFYLTVCERLRVRPEEAVCLDDLPACVEGARAVGMKAITFVENEQAIGELEAMLTPRGPRRGRARRSPGPRHGPRCHWRRDSRAES
jgi:FMN phosphatase YigB (HAD superfamily)